MLVIWCSWILSAYSVQMDSISCYHLLRHEDGSYNVIDARTGGPAEVEVEGTFFVLWKLTKEDAEG